MKNYLILLSLFFPFYGFSQQISENLAKTVAKNFLTEKLANNQKKAAAEQNFVITSAENQDSNYYIFNTEKNQGFVIVAANKKVYPILAYSIKNSFPVNNIPPEVQEWLNGYNLQIKNIQQLKISVPQKTYLAWEKYSSETFKPSVQLKESILNDIPPLISTTWNQGRYYNTLCPETSTGGSGGHVWAGCVATAMAQIMKYWNYPDNGQGAHSYTHSVYGELSADFQNTLYDWSNMPNSLSSENIEIARLIYHCGVSVNMNYSPSGSGAYSSTARMSLINYFKYSSNTLLTSKYAYSDENWKKMLHNELDEGRPMYYAGYGSGGHAFNLDGYQGTDFFHFNWGWGGAYNGYFYLDDLSPGANNFTNSQSAIIGIVPANLEAEFDSISAIILSCSTAYSGTTTDGTNSANIYSISSLHETGKEKIHKISTTLSGRITAKLSNLNADLDVFILKYADRKTALSYGDSIAFLDNAEPGTYYIVVDGKYATEGNYTLEVFCPDNRVDLIVEDATVEPMYVQQGQKFFPKYKIKNIGNSDADSSVVKYFLSKDKSLSSEDIFIDSLQISEILQKDSLNIGDELILPDIDTSGLMYLLIQIDANNDIDETDETLNLSEVFIQIPKKGLIDCSSAINLEDNVRYYGNTHDFGDSIIDNYSCYWGLTNKEVIHSFIPDYTGMVDMEFSESLEGVTNVLVLTGCNENACINTYGIWNLGDTVLNAKFHVAKGVRYYLAVDGNKQQGNSEGAYTLKVKLPEECPKPIINSPAEINKCDGDHDAFLYTDWGYSSYQWVKNGIDISGANSTGFAANESGLYQVKVTENGCTGISDTVRITYSPKPSGASISALSDTSFCEGGSVVLQLAAGTGYTYRWTNNNIPISGAEYFDYEAFETGVYRAEVTNISCTIKSNPITVTAYHAAKENGEELAMNKDSLISWWTFNNWGIDESGKGNYAGIFANLTKDRNGNYTAVLFNGLDNYISTSKQFEHPDTFTVSLWFKTNESGKLIGFDSLQYNTSGTSSDRHIYLDHEGLIHFGVDDGTKNVISSSNSYNDNQWHMATASLSASGMKLYIDAKLLAENTSVTHGAVRSGYWKMAYGSLSNWINNPNKEYFEGKLDDIAIYNRALSIDEIETLYNKQKIKIYTEQKVICTSTGSTNIIIENSEPDIEYQLIKSIDNSLVGSAVSGTSGTIYLNTDTLNETTSFKIFASNTKTLCTKILDSTYTIYVGEHVYPAVEIVSNKAGNTSCEGDTIVVSSNTEFAGNNPSYQWQINGVDTGTDTSIFISSTISDKDELTLYVSSSLECASPKTVSSESLIFTIHNLPDNSLTNHGSFELCEGDSSILSANANADYEWYLLGKAYRLDTTQSLIIDDEGAYFVKLTNEFACVSYSDTLEFYTFNLPEINLGKDTIIFTNQSIIIGTDNTYPYYLWNTGATEQKITIDGSLGLGVYEYWQRVTDEHCSNSDSIIITIEQITGFEGITSNLEIKIYPNPAHQFINIELNNSTDNFNIKMINSAGVLIWEKVYKANSGFIKDKISIGNYPKGIYFIDILNKNNLWVRKIIIE